MPTYEYHCTACDERFTRLESIAQHEADRLPSRVCPNCGSPEVERVFSPFFAKTVRKS